jgi:membrane associated rhomboid family serine protease
VFFYRAPDMSLLDKLERRFGFLAIRGLPRILVGFAALVFGLTWLLKTAGSAGYAQTLPDFTSMLTLDPVRIRHGEVWRLITYIFIPQATSPLWVLFALWFLWWVGEGLERAWGSFRLTL